MEQQGIMDNQEGDVLKLRDELQRTQQEVSCSKSLLNSCIKPFATSRYSLMLVRTDRSTRVQAEGGIYI